MLDLILKGGRVLDGTGAPDFPADVGIEHGRIAAIGRLEAAEAREIVEVAGLTVCPGFIDVHCHSDTLPFEPDPNPAKILQGVTTEVNGNCGFTLFPLAERTKALVLEEADGVLPAAGADWHDLAGYVERLRAAGPLSNVAPLVGHGAIRAAVLGYERRAPNPDELSAMRRLLAEALEQGAVGLSSGLIYAPGVYAETDELIALAEELRPSGRPYASHIRGETVTLFEAIDEAATIGERAGVPVQISHLKAAGTLNHGRADALLAELERRRAAGLEITADVYPYDGGSTSMAALLPPWCHEGGRPKLLEHLADPAARRRICDDFASGLPGWDNLAGAAGWERTYVATAENPAYIGRGVAELADALGQHPSDAFCTVLLEEEGRPTVVVRMMAEPDIRAILAHPLVMIGSDAIISRGRPHPRLWGTYPRVLGHYARDVGLFSQAEAVRKMTSFPARKFGLWDRGLVRPGMAADLVVFDPLTILDRATYEGPEQPPAGLPHVLVNGVFAVRAEVWKGTRAGRVGLA